MVCAKVKIPRVMLDLVNDIILGLSQNVPSGFGAIDAEKIGVAVGLPGAL